MQREKLEGFLHPRSATEGRFWFLACVRSKLVYQKSKRTFPESEVSDLSRETNRRPAIPRIEHGMSGSSGSKVSSCMIPVNLHDACVSFG